MSSNGKVYGPANPHPLSQLRKELVWEGKYDEYGNRREVDVAGPIRKPGSILTCEMWTGECKPITRTWRRT
jgi:hypothetical protein